MAVETNAKTMVSETNPSGIASEEARTALQNPKAAKDFVDPTLLAGADVSQIYPVVEIHLKREQDRTDPKRVQLAKEVASRLQKSLSADFQAQRDSSKFILLVHLTVLSDGSATARFWGNKLQIGRAKMGVTYCLFARESGKVAMTKSHFNTRGNWNGLEELCGDNGSRLVMALASHGAASISSNVVASIRRS